MFASCAALHVSGCGLFGKMWVHCAWCPLHSYVSSLNPAMHSKTLCHLSLQDETDKVIVLERGDLVMVFNFHPSSSYTDYRVGCQNPGAEGFGEGLSRLLSRVKTE